MMRASTGSVALPAQFEARYTVGQVLRFLPAFTGVLGLCWSLHSRWLPLFVAKYVLLLVFVAWLASRNGPKERKVIEYFAEDGPAFAQNHTGDRAAWHLAPVVGAAVIVGAALSAARHDVRWLILSSGVAVLLALGLMLRWLVYERWVVSELKMLELRQHVDSAVR